MVALSDPACKRCGGRMEIVADISPRDPEPGLRAFVCSECGAVESVLIYPDNHFGPKDPTYKGKRCCIPHHAQWRRWPLVLGSHQGRPRGCCARRYRDGARCL